MLCYLGIGRYTTIVRDADYVAPRRSIVAGSSHDGKQSRGRCNNCGSATSPARCFGDDSAVDLGAAALSLSLSGRHSQRLLGWVALR